jgi:2-polyprenyl-6-methoxyphenol hydroxylase-like FAD-dependent oxidoreductase
MKAIIIGGEIAVLASGLALTRRGWQVEVLERAPEFTEVGAGLSLWPNAPRALRLLPPESFARSMAPVLGWAA